MSLQRFAMGVRRRCAAAVLLVMPVVFLPAVTQAQERPLPRADLVAQFAALQARRDPDAVEAFLRQQSERARGLPAHDAARSDVLELSLNWRLLQLRGGEPVPATTLAEAEQLVRARRAARPPDPLLVAQALQLLGTLYFAAERSADADRAFEQMVEALRQGLRPDDPRLADQLGATAQTIAEGYNRPLTAARLYREAIAVRRAAGSRPTRALGADLQALGMLQMGSLDEFDAALANLQDADAIFTALHTAAAQDPDLVERLAQVKVLEAGLERQRGDTSAAQALLEAAEQLPAADAATRTERRNLVDLGRARVAQADGELARAVQVYEGLAERLVERLQQTPGDDTTRGLLLDCFLQSAKLLVRLDRIAEAERAAEFVRKTYSADDPMLADALFLLADIARLGGEAEKQDAFYREALRLRRQATSEKLVLFATSRKPLTGRATVGFGAEAASRLAFGTSIVLVPGGQFARDADRTAGAVELSTFGAATDPDQLALRQTAVEDWSAFRTTVRRRTDAESLYGRAVLVFVHGYNVTFDDALRRMGQLLRDLNHTGAGIVYSWPSSGQWWRYGTDRASAAAAAAGLRDLLQRLVREADVERIHIVAHSMGNRVLLPALTALADETVRARIGEVVLAAPAVGVDEFRTGIDALAALGFRRLTLYASRNDLALKAGFVREYGTTLAGFIAGGSPFLQRGLDTIDVSAGGMEPFELNHDVFAANPAIIADLRQLLQTGLRPPDRRLKFLKRQAGEVPSWRYEPK